MKINYFFTLFLFFAISIAEAQVIAAWDFNGDVSTPSVGAGTAATIGGVTASFAAGNPDRAWSTTGYPAQFSSGGFTGSGVEFAVSTLGYSNIVVSFDSRASSTASRWLELQYTVNGTVWITFWNNNGNLSPDSQWVSNHIDLSSVSALNDNPNFAIRLVTMFSPLAFDQNASFLDYAADTAYMRASQTSTNGAQYTTGGGTGIGNYGTSGTIRFDNVVFSAKKSTLNLTSAEIDYTQALPITGDIEVFGITNSAGQGAGMSAEIGMSFEEDTDPRTWSRSYSWKTLNYSADNGLADVYSGDIGPNYQDGIGNDVWYWAPGIYYYATRFNDGTSTLYGGVDASNVGGVWDGSTYKNGKLKIRTQVKPSQDGLTYTNLSSPINAVNAIDGMSYTFKFIDSTDGSLVGEYVRSGSFIRFSDLGSAATSRTYRISVKVLTFLGETIDYGPEVSITLDLTTSIKPSQCGLRVLNNATALFEALPVASATNYQFEVTVNGGTPEVITTPNSFFTFGELSTIPSRSATIGIRVRAEVAGNYADYGTSCNVFTDTTITQVRFSQCGITVPADNATVVINAIPVTDATNYLFRVRIGTSIETISTANSYFSFSQLSALPGDGETISISVRATVNGIVGNPGNSCSVFTTAVMDEEIIDNGYSSEKISAYPNPFSNQFTLKLANNTEATIQIFDINGRLISNQLVNDSYEVELGQNLTSGVYLVRVEQNNESTSLKMIKK